MKKTILAFVLLNCVSISYAGVNLDGEYLCANCNGYLAVKANTDSTYRVSLKVSGGSCGGLVYAENNAAHLTGNKFVLKWRLKRKSCKTEIAIDGNNASVSDSCMKPEDEGNSTCAVLGDYTKQRGSAK